MTLNDINHDPVQSDGTSARHDVIDAISLLSEKTAYKCFTASILALI